MEINYWENVQGWLVCPWLTHQNRPFNIVFWCRPISYFSSFWINYQPLVAVLASCLKCFFKCRKHADGLLDYCLESCAEWHWCESPTCSPNCFESISIQFKPDYYNNNNVSCLIFHKAFPIRLNSFQFKLVLILWRFNINIRENESTNYR